ncbi:MAG: hypothetical protein KKC68_07555 [Candidatus Thermoplasmatota archaeon]|nr:hypothetical protein [Candidatus Thermoplasmatota archaeon]MBU1941614.1 hypothetical protein [Candidatus Thermoplasmatota archaeon]
MVKKTFFFIALVLIVGSFAQATFIEQTGNGGGRSFDWVVMHYLNRDNTLSAAQSATLEELRVAGSTADVQAPYDSGETVVFNHTFEQKGTYMVRVKARDGLGAESTWGTLQVKMPYNKGVIASNPWSFLLGKISDIERNTEDDFWFLPQKVLYIHYTQEQGFSVQIIDELSGAFPCCGSIPDEDFYGKLRDSFIRGLCIIKILQFHGSILIGTPLKPF